MPEGRLQRTREAYRPASVDEYSFQIQAAWSLDLDECPCDACAVKRFHPRALGVITGIEEPEGH